jgi:aminoglycoside phosphotransferase family enzyme
MSRVFLAGDRVYKLKKPIRLTFLDYSTLDSRRLSCERELQLNRRLAPGVYIEVLPLMRRANGTLALGGIGEPIEWLLVMRRLSAARLLDEAIRSGSIIPADIEAMSDALGTFYAGTVRIECPEFEFLEGWQTLVSLVAASISDPQFALPADEVGKVIQSLRSFLERDWQLIAARLKDGRIVDGHGDLRPEHIHLGPPVRIIDRLEFDDRLRRTDPFDELSFLGVECRMLGANWIGRRLLDGVSTRLNDRPPDELLRFYRCYRAALRARLTIEHLRDPEPRTPERWPRQARAYLRVAAEHAAQS